MKIESMGMPLKIDIATWVAMAILLVLPVEPFFVFVILFVGSGYSKNYSDGRRRHFMGVLQNLSAFLFAGLLRLSVLFYPLGFFEFIFGQCVAAPIYFLGQRKFAAKLGISIAASFLLGYLCIEEISSEAIEDRVLWIGLLVIKIVDLVMVGLFERGGIKNG